MKEQGCSLPGNFILNCYCGFDARLSGLFPYIFLVVHSADDPGGDKVSLVL